MNEPKHTPGPWSVRKNDHSCVSGPRMSIDGSGRKIGTFTVASCLGYKDEREANARLIAAAPELLKALQACDRVFGAPNPDPLAAFATIEKARAAISKALGDA